MDITTIINTLFNLNVLIKLGGVILSFIFLMYSFILWRQIPIMNRSYQSDKGHALFLIASVQFIFSIFIFVLAFILL